jgi:PAS domain S-box-containing protein
MTRLQGRTDRRTHEIFASLEDRLATQTDRLFMGLMLVQWAFGIAISLWLSPRTWAGAESSIHPHVWAAIFLGGAISTPPVVVALLWPGRAVTRHVFAVAQMLTSGLLIHLTGGRIETHFHVFGSLAFLAFYRDYRVLVPATLVILADHLLRGMFWPQSVYGVLSATIWRTFEHGGWVVFEDAILVVYCLRGRRELWSFALRTARFEASEERYRAIVQHSADSIVVFDAETDEILECNPGFAAFAGAPVEMLVGLTVDQTMIRGCRTPEVKDDIAAIMRSGKAMFRERTLRRFDGVSIEASCSLSPTTYDGRPAICAVLHDISQRKQAEAELAHARDAAVDSARLKTEFLANMSHEIRTPMNGVMGMASLLLETSLTPQQRDFADTIHESADHLLTVINDILDFSKVEAGKLHFDTVDFDLRHELEAAVDLIAERAHANKLELALLIQPDVPAALTGDPGRLRQVVLNLMSNAVKFTEHGEVVVHVAREDASDERVRLRFEVRDTGVGIPAAAQAGLFEAFVQADGSTSRRYGGTGLGLAISRRLVELMNGSIGLQSEPGVGSTFWFTCELGRQAPGRAAPAGTPDLTGRRVLVVDDNATNRKVLHYQLSAWGALDTVVGSAASALLALKDAAGGGRPFDLIVLDRQMPGVDGVEFARRVRADAQIAAIPLIMMTSLGDPDDVPVAELAIASVLVKPVKAEPLRAALLGALAPAAAASPVRRPASPDPVAPAAIGRRRVLVAEDNVVNQKVALVQLRRLGHTAEAVSNGAEAIAALESVPYDLVLMDCQMPEMDGFEATRRIRGSGAAFGEIPIVAMTANALEGDRERCLAAGMSDYLSKPVRTADLEAILERWLAGVAPRREEPVLS